MEDDPLNSFLILEEERLLIEVVGLLQPQFFGGYLVLEDFDNFFDRFLDVKTCI